jgi:hypothetical protein
MMVPGDIVGTGQASSMPVGEERLSIWAPIVCACEGWKATDTGNGAEGVVRGEYSKAQSTATKWGLAESRRLLLEVGFLGFRLCCRGP